VVVDAKWSLRLRLRYHWMLLSNNPIIYCGRYFFRLIDRYRCGKANGRIDCLIIRNDDQKVGNDIKYLYANAFDYDAYLNHSLSAPIAPQKKYYVLLTNHPFRSLHDYVIAGYSGAITEAQYKKKINKFVDYFEKKTGISILISGHPKSFESEEIYNSRKLICGNTNELIANSCGVITHFTGALNYAILHHKPLCMITMLELDKDILFKNTQDAYIEALSCPVHYIGTESDLSNMFLQDPFYYSKIKYEEYIEKFLVSAVPEKEPLWRRVINMIEDQEI
jgi:hypothetical protein